MNISIFAFCGAYHNRTMTEVVAAAEENLKDITITTSGGDMISMRDLKIDLQEDSETLCQNISTTGSFESNRTLPMDEYTKIADMFAYAELVRLASTRDDLRFDF